MRRIQARMLGVDGDEHLYDVIFRQAIEDDCRHTEVLALEALDVGMKREKTMLAVDGSQNPFTLRHLENAQARVFARRLKRQLLVARNDHRPGNRREIARLTALFVVLNQLVDLAPDDVTLVRLLARRDSPLE